MTEFEQSYSGTKVVITGHTGFKGGWLALWLKHLGADVVGISNKESDSAEHMALSRLDIQSHTADIRDMSQLNDLFQRSAPSIVFHLAAQPLVRRSYKDPLETWTTNLVGTANVLEACRNQLSVRAIVIITTDKVYANQNWTWGYREIDRLGGHDPYSASKAACELLVDSYRKSFFDTEGCALLASVRAGNVLGGGDWSEDRLIPDIIRALQEGRSLEIRNPLATRPWQHVLDPLSGYLLIGQHLLAGRRNVATAWNFGPTEDGNRSVSDVLNTARKNWPELLWRLSKDSHPHESAFLFLNTDKARTELSWRPVWNFEQTIAKTAEWYKVWTETKQSISAAQLAEFLRDAKIAGVPWCQA